MARSKARLFLAGESRSTSRDRFDLEAARFNHTIPNEIEEEQESELEEEGEAGEVDEVEGENNALASSSSFRKPFRVGSFRVGSTNYGSVEGGNGIPHYLQLDGELTKGLKRNESIFKLAGMINDKSGEYEKFRMSEEDMKSMKSKVKEFYRTQNEVLDSFAEVDEILESTRILQEGREGARGESSPLLIPSNPSAARESAHNSRVKLVINVNIIINFLLLFGKIAVVLLSNSMSLIASTVDSAMDFLSTVIIFGTNRVIEHRDWKSTYNYPTGKKRMEPVGILVFSVFMIASFLQVFIESVQRLLNKNLEPAAIPLSGILVMSGTIVIKVFVWFWCRRVKNSSIAALAQDAENDIVFNFFSLLFPYIGQKLGWKYLDPLGGAVLSIYIIVEWTQTLLENVQKLSGKRGSPQQHQRIAYMLTRFDPLIIAIQHLSVYSVGDNFIVETDVVLPADTDLTVSHDIGEAQQYALEQLEGIERAYVHIDISVNPLSGHLER